MSAKSIKFTIGENKTDRYANLLKKKLQSAKSEDDVRILTTQVLTTILDEFKIPYEHHHEVTLLKSGRADSIFNYMFNRIIIEYKDYGYFKTERGINEALYGRSKKDRGLIDYIFDLAIESSIDLETFKENIKQIVGVAFDGNYFIFVRYIENEEKEVTIRSSHMREWCPDKIEGDLEITIYDDLKEGLRKFLLYIRALRKMPLDAKNLLDRFGVGSSYCKKHLLTLYQKLIKSLEKDESHVKTLYDEWDRLFGIIYGDIATATTDVKNEIKKSYGVTDISKLKIREFIFTIHTYYSIILKILVSELLASLINPFRNGRDIRNIGNLEFLQIITDIVKGKKFKSIGIENFFEGGFFEWYLYVWDSDISNIIKDALDLFREMETTTSVIKPESIRDMIKIVYQDIMPNKLRHLLGEYFTPDWLAEYVIEKTGFSGLWEENLLDPTCGSGTFLSIAIKLKRLRNKDADRRELIQNILQTIVGFDLNPISVIASKTNYLLSLGDFFDLGIDIKIPVYLCDSVLTPTVHAKQKANKKSIKIKDTVVGDFNVPVFDTRAEIDGLLDLITECIENEFSIHEFEYKINKEEYPPDKTEKIIELFKKIKELEDTGRNGVWACLLKNSFAPIYTEQEFDYVVGNPPWISWRNMSKTYRDSTLPIWLSYGIFEKSGYDAITTHDDFAMAITYVSADHFLKSGGKLGFVISQTFFKSAKGGEGFRKFRITREFMNEPLKVESVDDMVDIKPFEKVTNRTSVVLITKGEETKYPLPYYIWKRKKGVKRINSHLTFEEMKNSVIRRELVAIPISQNHRSPWLTIHESMIESIKKLLGNSPYRGRKGVEPLGAKGVYVLNTPKELANGNLQISNDLNRGRLEDVKKLGVHLGRIEPDFVFPLISGRNITRWGIKDTSYILMPHKNEKGPHNAVPETELKTDYPKTYTWLKYFYKVLLETRKRHGKFFDEKIDPFYALDNVGTYTFKPYKVVWAEQKREMMACVVSRKQDKPLQSKLIIPDSKVLFCPLESEDEAHYLCAILNSLPVRYIIENYTIETQLGIDVLNNIKIPKFSSDNEQHSKLSKLSIDAHNNFKDKDKIKTIEYEVNKTVCEMFDLELNKIEKFYEGIEI